MNLLVIAATAMFVAGCQATSLDPATGLDHPAAGLDHPAAGLDHDALSPVEVDSPLLEQATSPPGCGSYPAGALDRTFGGAGTGVARLSIRPDDGGGVRAMDLQGDHILAAGDGQGGLGGSTFKLARLDPEGLPDIAFMAGRVIRTQWGRSTANYAYVRAAGHQQSGRTIMIGGFQDGKRADIALAAYTAEGWLDTAGFAGYGGPIIDLGGAETVEDGLVLPDDRIVVAGSRDGQWLLAAFTPDGELDTSFGDGGYLTGALGDSSTAAAVAMDRAGRLVVTGDVQRGAERDAWLMRLFPDGDADPFFGDGGLVIFGDAGRDERAVAVAVGRCGAVTIAGDAGAGRHTFLVARFHPDGTPDDAFGKAGVATGPGSPRDDRAEAMSLLPGGAVLVAGNARDPASTVPLVARYTPDGELDPTFGQGGIIHPELGEYGVLSTLLLDRQGRALLGGGDEGATPGPGTFLVVARMCL